MTVEVEWKELLPKRSSIIIWSIIGLVYFISCEDKIGDKIIITEEQSQEPTR